MKKPTINEAAAAMGRRGGKARAAKLTPERLREIGRMGGAATRAKALQRKAHNASNT